MTTPTLKELVARATPGPWTISLLSSRVVLTETTEDTRKKICEANASNAEFIARLSPEVALRLYNLTAETGSIGLHEPDENGPCLCGQCARSREAHVLLLLFDGKEAV